MKVKITNLADMKKISNTFIVMLIIVMIGIPALLIAQPLIDDPDVGDVPFDGGVSLLIAAGVGYGLKKVYNKKKAEKL